MSAPTRQVPARSTPSTAPPLRLAGGLVLALALAFRACPTAAGGFAPGAITSFTTVNNPRAVATGDVNADGILDMVVPSSTGSGIAVFRGLGAAPSRPPRTSPATPPACRCSPTSISTASSTSRCR